MDEALSRARLEAVMKTHPGVRYIRLISQTGQALASASRKEDESLEPPGETDIILRRLALARGMTSGTESFYGRARAILILREKLTELVYLFGQIMVLVGADPDFPLGSVGELEEALQEFREGADGSR